MGEPSRIGELKDDELKRVLERGLEALATPEELECWEAQQARRDRRDRLDQCGIGDHLDQVSVAAVVDDALAPTRALHLVKLWMPSPRPALVLLSKEPGLGKTTAAAWALARSAGRYAAAQDLCELRSDRRGRAEFERVIRGGLLVIDELGRERDAEEAHETFQAIIDVRQRSARRTLILGNLGLKELVARYDKRTLDRLGVLGYAQSQAEGDASGIAIVRMLDGTSFRQQRPKEGDTR